MKQIATGMMMYVQDYDGRYFYRTYGAATPGAGTGYNSFWAPLTAAGYDWFMEPYVKNRQVYNCPVVISGQTGYGYNYYPAVFGRVDSQLSAPAETLAFVDNQFNAFLAYPPSSGAAWETVFCASLNTSPCPTPKQRYGRHLDGVNVAYMDGHVKFQRIETLWNNGVDTLMYDGLRP